MKSKLLKTITQRSALRAAWRKVYSNGKSSRSDRTRDEVNEYAQDAERNIQRLQRQVNAGTYVFQPAVGKKLPKGKVGDFRPLVIAPIETRILQRAVLDFLLRNPSLASYADTPHSFGGVKKRDTDELAAVPAAIQAALEAKASGLEFLRCADIASFFTKIRKSSVRKIVASAIPDPDFLCLFDQCVNVELSNLSELGAGAQRFPREDLGVAQGSSLSPFMGNILLHDFDKEMNTGECRCIRYIDDILILGPTEATVSAQFKAAKRYLAGLEMSFSSDKSSFGVQSFTGGFSFLGIEIINGLIRPDGKSVGRLKTKIHDLVTVSSKQMLGTDESFESENSLVRTMARMSGTVHGWGKHYRFCNDTKILDTLDLYVDGETKKLLRAYVLARKKRIIPARRLLGISSLSDLPMEPFLWPKSGTKT